MSKEINYSEITPQIERLAAMSKEAGVIDSDLFVKYDVKRGLRDLNGKGVLAGLTHISDVRATKVVDGQIVPDYGSLLIQLRSTRSTALRKLHIFYYLTSCLTNRNSKNSAIC